ncbi:MAG: isoprenylcysteine carboxylmethyltransferase family protein [Anaerolineae bacterium]|nr:isoprenylcysteine carboxylmethyltransferase family protein [Anaerolineae bacterium]
MQHNTPMHLPTSPINRHSLHSLMRDVVIVPGIVTVLMFIGRGTVNWLWGWVFAGLYILAALTSDLVVLRLNPDLLSTRGERDPHMQRWDLVLVLIFFLALITTPFTAGLDVRYEWSASVSPIVRGIGVGLMLVAYIVGTGAMIVNPHFEPSVRIQERHQVISSGIYRYIRHPGYTSGILMLLAIPLILGTWTAYLPASVGTVAFIIRTELEDRTLQRELPGYLPYTRQTRFRLLPGIW